MDRIGSEQIEQNQIESFSSGVKQRYTRIKPKKLRVSNMIQQELEEMQSNPSDDFKCLALESNPYDWQFAIKGPNGTEFAGGIYHGQITIPVEYPKKPPIITLLTENGRFKTQTNIDYFGVFFFWNHHSRVRSALLRLIELLPTYPDGKLGSVEYDKEERRRLATESREAAPIYGTDERQKLINEIHKYMLSKTPPVPSNGGGDIRVSFQNDRDRRKQGIVTIKGKRKQGISLFFGNVINADKCKRVGFFDFEKRQSCLWSWS